MQQDLQRELVRHLKDPASYPASVHSVQHIETHISHVFLTGEYAYKLKKAVKFDFLDFTTLAKRKLCCLEELRLNSRFSPDLYLEVLPVSRQGNLFALGSANDIVDYVVKMRQFDEGSLFDQLSARGELRQSLLLQITDVIASFHLKATPRSEYWSYEYVLDAVNQNLEGCLEFCPEVLDRSQVELLRDRSQREIIAHKDLIHRRQKSHVRELHGDLHLKNMCLYQNRAALFDGIEFNPQLSNCDVWADLAFFIMDLMFRNMQEEAALVWNHYLQETDDFEGFQLLNLYVSYRAAIRARISCLEIESADTPAAKDALAAAARAYIALAESVLAPRKCRIIAVGGLAGSGKSTLSSLLAQRLQAVHIRSDAVRKHLCGVPPTSKAPQRAYSEEMNKKTYEGMLDRARNVIASRHPVILDAVYHSQICREDAEAFAEKASVPFVGLWCEVSPKIAQERVRMRIGDISDADESILTLQQSYELGEIEWHTVDTSQHELQSVDAALRAL